MLQKSANYSQTTPLNVTNRLFAVFWRLQRTFSIHTKILRHFPVQACQFLHSLFILHCWCGLKYQILTFIYSLFSLGLTKIVLGVFLYTFIKLIITPSLVFAKQVGISLPHRTIVARSCLRSPSGATCFAPITNFTRLQMLLDWSADL